MQYNDKNLKRYLKKVNKLLKFPSSIKKRIIRDFHLSVSDFIEATPNYTITDIENHFGTPESFVNEYILSLSQEDLKYNLKKARQIKLLIAIIFLIVLLGIATCIILLIIYNVKTTGGYYYIEIGKGTDNYLKIYGG